MSESLSSWLALREPADFAARSSTLTQAIVETLAGRDPVHVLDLGTGRGSNVRYLSPHLPPRQRWLVVDCDPTLLAQASALMAGRGDCRIEARQIDLGSLDDRGLFSGRHLVTASALLDLVSDSWLSALAERCREAGAAVLFPLNYNGRSRCSPEEPEDAIVLDLMNRHQHTDKGLGGPAAGPDAAAHAMTIFADAGYDVRSERTDWMLEPHEREFQRRLVEGWAEAAREIDPGSAARITGWLGRRLAHVVAGRSRIAVGHDDVAAWVPR